MKKLTKWSIIGIAALTALLFFQSALAQPPRAKERLDQLKKTMLLEQFNLSEADADKLLVKYTAWEKQIKEKKDAYDKSNEDLKQAIAKQSKDLAQVTQKVLDAQIELHNTMANKLKDMKSLFNETDYAKFVVFESEFHRELQQMIMERRKMFREERRKSRFND